MTDPTPLGPEFVLLRERTGNKATLQVFADLESDVTVLRKSWPGDPGTVSEVQLDGGECEWLGMAA